MKEEKVKNLKVIFTLVTVLLLLIAVVGFGFSSFFKEDESENTTKYLVETKSGQLLEVETDEDGNPIVDGSGAYIAKGVGITESHDVIEETTEDISEDIWDYTDLELQALAKQFAEEERQKNQLAQQEIQEPDVIDIEIPEYVFDEDDPYNPDNMYGRYKKRDTPNGEIIELLVGENNLNPGNIVCEVIFSNYDYDGKFHYNYMDGGCLWDVTTGEDKGYYDIELRQITLREYSVPEANGVYIKIAEK